MATRSLFLIAGLGVPTALLAACTGRSSTPAPGIHSAESAGATVSHARVEDCGTVPYYDANAQGLARLASRNGVPARANPVDALRSVLTHGSEPFWGGRGGSGVVGLGYPASGWTQISATQRQATFRAPLDSGTAELTLTRVGGRWLVSHLEKNC